MKNLSMRFAACLLFVLCVSANAQFSCVNNACSFGTPPINDTPKSVPALVSEPCIPTALNFACASSGTAIAVSATTAVAPCVPNWVNPVCDTPKVAPVVEPELDSAAATAAATQAAQTLTASSALGGDEATACEAILCLAGGSGFAECTRSLTKYFSIVKKTLRRTLQARADFLALCPVSSDLGRPVMIDAMIGGAGQCDPKALNTNLAMGQFGSDAVRVSSSLPESCNAYFSRPEITAERPVFFGTEGSGGRWVTPGEYARLAAEQATAPP